MASRADWRPLYPFESRWLTVGGHRYHFVDEGRGDVLLLVHGNPTWSFYWRELIAAWRERFRVVAADHIGCGLSDKPTRYRYCLDQHAENLSRLIEHLDLERITLVGHDWGGAIGMAAAVRDARRFARFVLMNTAAFHSRRMPWRIRFCRTPLLGRFVVRRLNGFLRAAFHLATAKPRRITPEVRAGYLAPYASAAERIAIHRFVRDIPLGPRHPSYPVLAETEAGLSQFRDHPVQLIWGMRDWCFTPHFLDRFLEFFPAAEVQRIDDAGHWVVEDAHEQIAPAVEAFLDRHPLYPPPSAGKM